GWTGVWQEAAMAADRVILLADEIVEPAVIASDPNRVLYPGFRVSAVVEARAGVHPSPMTGVWQRDTDFFNDYHRRSRERDGFLAWLEEWVLAPADHAAYLDKLGDRLDRPPPLPRNARAPPRPPAHPGAAAGRPRQLRRGVRHGLVDPRADDRRRGARDRRWRRRLRRHAAADHGLRCRAPDPRAQCRGTL